MSIYFPGMEMPKGCMTCEWRDAEACGECELMIDNPFKSFAEQYEHCPFNVIKRHHRIISVQEHGDLIDRNALKISTAVPLDGKPYRYVHIDNIEDAPIVIPADPVKEVEG